MSHWAEVRGRWSQIYGDGSIPRLFAYRDNSDADRALVAGLGADTIVERGDDVAVRILEIVPEGVGVVVDAAVQKGQVASAVRPGERSCRSVAGQAMTPKVCRSTWSPSATSMSRTTSSIAFAPPSNNVGSLRRTSR